MGKAPEGVIMRIPKQAGALVSGILCLLLVVALRGWDPPFLAAQRAAGFDTLQRVWPRPEPEGVPIRIVDIDEASLSKLGQWPWPRDRLAALVNELSGLGAAAIAFDIVFPEADRMSPRKLAEEPGISEALGQAGAASLPDFDQEFAQSISGKPVVLAFANGSISKASELPTKTGFAVSGAPADNAPPRLNQVTANIAPLHATASGLGNINIDLAGQQGVVREMPMLWRDETRFFPSLGVEALRVAQGAGTILINADVDETDTLESIRVGEIEFPVTESGTFPLYFRKNPAGLYVPAASVIDGTSRDELRPLIEGHIVFVGTSAVGLLDSRTTPLGETVPGVSIHAQALEQILAGQFLSRPNWLQGLEIAGAALLSLGAVAGAAFARPAASTALAALAAGLVMAVVIYGFRQLGLLMDATFPLLALGLSFLAATAYRLLVTDRLGRQMRSMFGHYVAPSVLAEIERNPETLKLGGEVRQVTVLFLDIADFTPLSEKLRPDALVAAVNGLWDVCSKAILAENGTIDKFIGDAIMAFWNAPTDCPDHQYRACRAALAIRAAVKAYNESPELRARLAPADVWPLKVRVGLASGEACVGNMGSTDRFDYSVIGETVNTAARAESACKHVQHDIVLAGEVDGATRKLAVLPAGHVHLKGRSHPQPVTIIVGDETEALTSEFEALRKEHAHLASRLADAAKAGKKPRPAIQQLLAELAIHQPRIAQYLTAMPKRPTDFVGAAVKP